VVNPYSNEESLLSMALFYALAPNCRAPELARSSSRSGDLERAITYSLSSVDGAGAATGAGAEAGAAAGAGAGATTITLTGVLAGAGATTVVLSFSLLQPANNASVTKPAAIIALVFIVVSYCFKFGLGFIPEKISSELLS
jgi:hypothetical protein